MRGLLVLAALTALMVHPVRAAENAAVETLPESSPAGEGAFDVSVDGWVETIINIKG